MPHDIKKRNQLEFGKNIVVIGQRGAGKSHFIKSLNLKRHHSEIHVFTETKINDFYTKELGIPDRFVHEDLTEKLLSKIIDDRKRNFKKKRKDGKKFIAVVLDDVLGFNSRFLYSSRALKHLFSAGRHIFCTVIICLRELDSVKQHTRINGEND